MSACDGDCPPGNPREQVRQLYTELAQYPERDFGWGRGYENARSLGYAADWLERLPDCVWESAAAVGNPFSLGLPLPGETVVDVGSGAGADACVASLIVGGEGRVVGIDCTPAMVAKASRNAQAAGLSNIRFLEAEMSALPLPDTCADMVISNGVINLSMDKPRVLAELFRVLRPGGRLQIADMVRDPSCAAHACSTGGESWADCVSGTLESERFLELLSAAGFADAVLTCFTGYRTSTSTIGALFRGSHTG
jgi:SAM-dependent methyltransferase